MAYIAWETAAKINEFVQIVSFNGKGLVMVVEDEFDLATGRFGVILRSTN